MNEETLIRGSEEIVSAWITEPQEVQRITSLGGIAPSVRGASTISSAVLLQQG
nr:hypothetical protein [uncultured bacterium]